LNNLVPHDYDWRYIASAIFVQTASNRPTNSNNGIVFCFGIDLNNYYQLAVCNNAKLFVRHSSFGNWTNLG